MVSIGHGNIGGRCRLLPTLQSVGDVYNVQALFLITLLGPTLGRGRTQFRAQIVS